MTLPQFVPLDETFDAQYGLEVLTSGPERVTARIPLANTVRQPLGLVHGGVYASAAESMTSAATAHAVWEDGFIAMGMSNNTSFLRPITDGDFIYGEAIRRHRGQTTWLWDVEFTDDQSRLCATTRMTIAVRPRDDSSQA